MSEVTRVGLVGCASAKLSRPAPARDLYTSALFRKASAYAERECDLWFILSAKHGLLDPDEVIEPYDVRLGCRRTGPIIWDWAHRVQDQLAVALDGVPKPLLVVLAGEQYRTILHPCQWPFTIPMKGLGIGEQLSWLTKQNVCPAHEHGEHDWQDDQCADCGATRRTLVTT